MIWYLPLAGAALLVLGFLIGAALRPKDVRRDVSRLIGEVSQAREARNRLHASLDRAIDANLGLRRERTEARRQVINLQLEKHVLAAKVQRLEDAESDLGLVQERVSDTLVSLEMWRAMVDRDEYDVDGLPEDLASLARQLGVDAADKDKDEVAAALEGGERS